jgi:hypothetical protein
MTLRLVFACALVACLGRPAFAQEAPAADLFGGYSLLPSNVVDDFPRRTSHGIQGGVGIHLNRWFGVAADVGMQWNATSDLGPNFEGLTARTTVREFLVGPRFTARSSRVDAFVHAWLGTSIGNANEDFAGFADSGMTFGGGGGVDVRVAPRVAVRVQLDLLGSFADIVESNSRVGAGVVYRIGRR